MSYCRYWPLRALWSLSLSVIETPTSFRNRRNLFYAILQISDDITPPSGVRRHIQRWRFVNLRLPEFRLLIWKFPARPKLFSLIRRLDSVIITVFGFMLLKVPLNVWKYNQLAHEVLYQWTSLCNIYVADKTFCYVHSKIAKLWRIKT